LHYVQPAFGQIWKNPRWLPNNPQKLVSRHFKTKFITDCFKMVYAGLWMLNTAQVQFLTESAKIQDGHYTLKVSIFCKKVLPLILIVNLQIYCIDLP
jgi:hypothetical protein